MPRTKGSTDKTKRKVTKSHSGHFKKGNKMQSKGTRKTQTSPSTLNKVSNIKIDKALVDRYLTANSHMSVEGLIERLQLGGVSILEGMLIKGMLKAYRTGDPHNLSFFLDRLIGKVPTRIAHSLENELAGMDDEQLMREKEKYALALRSEIKDCEVKVKDQLDKFEKTEFIDNDGEIRTAKDIVDTSRQKQTHSANKDKS